MKNLSVDERICPHTGRTGLKRYVPKKPKNWGFKLYLLCDAEGFVYNYEMCGGEPKEDTPIGRAGEIVLRLARIIPRHRGFRLTCDNYFTSIQLFVALDKLGIQASGTARVNRLRGVNFSTDAYMKKRGRGTHEAKVTSTEGTRVAAVKFHDNKSVHLISTHVGARPLTSGVRWSTKLKKTITISVPAIVKSYNRSMGGVDRANQYVSYFRTIFRSKRWYLKLFFHLIDTVCANAWLLYRRDSSDVGIPAKRDLLFFKMELADGLTRAGKTARNRGRPPKEPRGRAGPPPVHVRKDRIDHFPAFGDKKRCHRCCRTTTVTCGKCDVNLCFVRTRNCFKLFHL